MLEELVRAPQACDEPDPLFDSSSFRGLEALRPEPVFETPLRTKAKLPVMESALVLATSLEQANKTKAAAKDIN